MSLMDAVLQNDTDEVRRQAETGTSSASEWRECLRWAADSGNLDNIDIIIRQCDPNDFLLVSEMRAGLEYALGNGNRGVSLKLASLAFDDGDEYTDFCSSIAQANLLSEEGYELSKEIRPLVDAGIMMRKIGQADAADSKRNSNGL